jgi:hypothetical protein
MIVAERPELREDFEALNNGELENPTIVEAVSRLLEGLSQPSA